MYSSLVLAFCLFSISNVPPWNLLSAISSENRSCPIHWLMTCKTSKLQIPSIIKRSSNFMKSCQLVKDVNIEAAAVLCEAGRVQNISNLCSMETPECLKISLHNSRSSFSAIWKNCYRRVNRIVLKGPNTSALKSKWVKSFKIVEGIDSVDIFNLCLQWHSQKHDRQSGLSMPRKDKENNER